jgi:hypothetical protein
MKVAHDDFVGLMAANLLSRGEGGNLEFVTTDGKSLFAHRPPRGSFNEISILQN